MKMLKPNKRKRVGPKRRFMDAIRENMKVFAMQEEEDAIDLKK